MAHVNWTEVFKASKTPWFRARTYHEYGSMWPMLRTLVNFDQSRILDFGCGALPIASASIALRHPEAEVYGSDVVDADLASLNKVLKHEATAEVPPNLHLIRVPPSCLPETLGSFDLIYSWSVFEHIFVHHLYDCFRVIRDRLKDEGVFFFQIGGIYFSDKGSHLDEFFPNEPWHHLVRSLDELHQGVFASDRALESRERHWRQFIELNRLSIDDFLDIAQSAGLKLVREERLRTDRDPPPRLLRIYTSDALKCFEIRAIFMRV